VSGHQIYGINSQTVPASLTEDLQAFDFQPKAVSTKRPKRVQRQVKTKKNVPGHKRRRSEPIPQTEGFFPLTNIDIKSPNTQSKINFNNINEYQPIQSQPTQIFQQIYNSELQQPQFTATSVQMPIISASQTISFPLTLSNSLNPLFPILYINQNDLSFLNQSSIPQLSSSSFASQSDDSGNIRGKYKCGLCGKPKANHNCLFKTKQPLKNKGIQTDTKGIIIGNHTQFRTIVVSSSKKKEEFPATP